MPKTSLNDAILAQNMAFMAAARAGDAAALASLYRRMHGFSRLPAGGSRVGHKSRHSGAAGSPASPK